MNLTKSVRELATDINAAAPDNYDSNDEVSEKWWLRLSLKPLEFSAAKVKVPRTGERIRPSHWQQADGCLVKCVHMPSPLLCYLTPDFSLDGGDSCSLLYIINSASTPSSIF
jgi:hypothetical protein